MQRQVRGTRYEVRGTRVNEFGEESVNRTFFRLETWRQETLDFFFLDFRLRDFEIGRLLTRLETDLEVRSMIFF